MLIILMVYLGYYGAASEVRPAPLVQMGNGSYYSKHAFVVDKKKRSLTLWERQSDGGIRKIHEYVADMGKSQGDKLADGDHKTPEGVYFLLDMLRGKKIPFELYGSRAYTTDYPNYFDERAGKTGYGIWLHAVPDSVPLTRGSRGCVVIRDWAIREVESYFKPKTTPIVIEDDLQIADISTIESKRTETRKFLQNWLAAWQSKDISQYMDFYHERFVGKKMNKRGWERYKTRVKASQKFSSIRISEPIILASGSETTIRFLQHFESDTLSDYGEKTLYLLNTEDGPKIYGEKWRAVRRSTVTAELSSRPFTVSANY